VSGLVLNQLAASAAVLSEDEKNLGVCVVDMGGGTCDAVYFVNGSVAHTSIIPLGGHHFTHDVAVGLRTPQISAEDLKRKYGCAMASMVNENETIEVEGVGGRKSRLIPRKDLADVLEARAEESLNLIAHDMRRSGLLPMLGSGLVLTGGASQLDGLVEMGEFIFDIPVRRGGPSKVGGLIDAVKAGEHSAAVGLLLYGLSQRKDLIVQSQQSHSTIKGEMTNLGESFDGITQKVKDFFGQIF
jgi:cell division protein FtsA